MLTDFFCSKEGKMMNPILLTERQAAEFLTIRVKTLQAWRVRGRGPKFIKLGGSVRYRREDLEQFLDEHTRVHTQGK
jgi:predicted DNA-binding transcriptional regulator AlpA